MALKPVKKCGTLLFPFQISAVGVLSLGSSIITFHILNTTDMTSEPTPVAAGIIATAFAAANVQEVDSYPVSRLLPV